MAQILMPERPKDQLTAIAQALSIAQNIYGLKTSSANFDRLQKQQDYEEALKDPNSPEFQQAQQIKIAEEQRQYANQSNLAKVKAQADAQEFKTKQDYANELKAKSEENKYQKEQSRLTVPGFTKTNESVNVNTKDVEELKKSSEKSMTIMSAIDGIEQRLQKSGPTLGTLPSQDNALLKQELSNLQLELKEFKNLGVLNGPDINIINENIGEITGPKAKLLGKEAAIEKLNNLRSMINKSLDSKASARGFTRMGQQEDTGKSIPEVVEQDGVIFQKDPATGNYLPIKRK